MLDGFTGTDLAIYGLAGALLPLLVAVINRPHFPAWAKQLIMVAVAVVVGLIAYALKNHLDLSNGTAILTAVGGVVAAAQVAYRALWSKGVAPALERNLNGGTTTATPDDAEPIDEDEGDPDSYADEPLDYDTPTVDGAELGPADEPQPEHAA